MHRDLYIRWNNGPFHAVKILEATLLQSSHEIYPDLHQFMADNDPKHTSVYTCSGISLITKLAGAHQLNHQI